jgi:CRP/FNR family transcriptional regulator, cyclic AMP receptor protein
VIDVALVRSVPVFGDFSDAEIAAICSTVTKRHYARHEFIVRESDSGDAFYIVTRGSVAVCHAAPDGHETILSILKEGDFFGEMAMFDSSLRSASIKTLTEVEVGLIQQETFLAMLEQHPRLTRQFVVVLAERLRSANRLVATTTSQDARARVASLLLYLAERFGEPIETGTRITLRLTHQEMANMIGTTRETVNRALNRFWDEHLVDRRNPLLVLTDLNGLRALL